MKEGDIMNINTKTIVPISIANQNFSKVAKLVDQFGSAVIMKNNIIIIKIFKLNYNYLIAFNILYFKYIKK